MGYWVDHLMLVLKITSNLDKHLWKTNWKTNDSTLFWFSQTHNWYFRLSMKCSFKHFVNPLEIFSDIVPYYKTYETPSFSTRLRKTEPLLYFRRLFFEIQFALSRPLEHRFCHLIPSLPPLLSLTLFSPFIFLIIWNTPKSNQGMSEFEGLMDF